MILHYDGAVWSKVFEREGEEPESEGAGLRAVSGASDEDVVVVGYGFDELPDGGASEQGAWIRRFDGVEWTDMDVELDLVLTDVEWTKDGYRALGRNPGADAPGGSFASVVLRFDADAWGVEADVNGLLRGIGGAGGGTVFAVGDYGKIVRWDGDAWQVMVNGAICHRISDVWAPPDGPVAASCEQGGLLVGDGFEWTDAFGDTGYRLQGVWTDGQGRIVAVGDEGAVLGYDSGEWTTMASNTEQDLADIWGASADDLVAVGLWPGALLRFDGAKWRSEDSGISRYGLHAVAGNAAGEVWAVGHQGLVLKHPCDAR
jgi:hypothetical protein